MQILIGFHGSLSEDIDVFATRLPKCQFYDILDVRVANSASYFTQTQIDWSCNSLALDSMAVGLFGAVGFHPLKGMEQIHLLYVPFPPLLLQC